MQYHLKYKMLFIHAVDSIIFKFYFDDYALGAF